MTNTALKDLLAKVAAGDFPMGRAADSIEGTGLDRYWSTGFDAFSGSLDAAKKLHEAVLPGWTWGLRDNGVAQVRRWPTQNKTTVNAFVANNPARSWLIAILKALIWEASND